MNCKSMIIFIGIIFIISLSSANIPIYVKPIDGDGNLMPNTVFNYTFNWTTDSSCLNVVLNHTELNLLIDNSGIGFVNVNSSSISDVPNYLCEYKNGVLRKVHTLSDQTFRNVYADTYFANNWSNISASQINNNVNWIDSTNVAYVNKSNVFSGLQTMGSLYVSGNVSVEKWFNGLFNWTTLSNWLSFDGAILSMNESKLNDTFYRKDNNINAIGYNITTDKVGIGTTAPSDELNVVGYANITKSLLVGDNISLGDNLTLTSESGSINLQSRGEIMFGDPSNTKIGIPDPAFPTYFAFTNDYTDMWLGVQADPSLYFNYYAGSNIYLGTAGNSQTVTLTGDFDMTGDLTADGTFFGKGGGTFGSLTHRAVYNSDGVLSLSGNARVWKAVELTPSNVGKPSSNPPAVGEYQGFEFDRFDRGTEEQVYYVWHIPPDFAGGSSNVRGHFGFFVENPPSGADEVVVLGFEYKRIAPNSVFDFSSGATNRTIETTIVDGESAYKWHESSTGVATTTSWDPGDIVMFRFYRDATNVSDTYDNEAVGTDNDVWIGQYHLEYLSNKLGGAS